MKRIIIFSLVAFLVLCGSIQLATANEERGVHTETENKKYEGIRLSEIMFYPGDSDSGAEWIELYNDSEKKPVDISGYELCNAAGVVYSFPVNLPKIPPGAYVLIEFDGQDAAENDLSFDDDNLAVLHVDRKNMFADEGDICVLYKDNSRSKESICGFVSWGNIEKPTFEKTIRDKESVIKAKKAKELSHTAEARRLWKRGTPKTFVSVPDLEGPNYFLEKDGSLVLINSGSRTKLTAVPCKPGEITPGYKNVIPAPGLWLPHDNLQTSADLFTFSWLPVSSSTYQFQICMDKNCTAPIIDVWDLTEPHYQPVSPLNKNASYYWRVRAINNGLISDWSEVRKFSIGYSERLGRDPLEIAVDAEILAAGDNPLGVLSRPARKDSSLLCLDGCDEEHWDADNSSGAQHEHSMYYCWAAAAQMLSWYRGGNVLQDEIVAIVKGSNTAEPEDWLPHGSNGGATQGDGFFSLRYALQATQSQLHVIETKPTEAELAAFIDADRPVRYSTGGHAMVVDGYRTAAGGVFEARFLNTDNNGTIEWRPWDAEPFKWCAVPDSDLIGRTVDPRMTTDSDGDGMMDFDEEERFFTDSYLFDTDDDLVGDKADVASYALRRLDPDVDADGLRGEIDEDSDDDGVIDGEEDLDQDGRFEPSDDETDPHQKPADDRQKLDLIFCINSAESMYDNLVMLNAAAGTIVNNIATEILDFRIAVVDYRDFPVSPYGCDDDYEYRDVSGFSNDQDSAVSAIKSLRLGCENDWQESVYSALMHSVDSTSLGSWRDQPVKKAIIFIGNAPPHDPEPFTGYTMADVIQAAQDVDPVNIFSVPIGGDSTTLAYFTEIADGTGGDVFPAADHREIIGAIMDAIKVIIDSPFADAGGPYLNETGQTILFDASGSYEPDGEIVLYEWDWDSDGIYDESTTEPTIEHTWHVEFSDTVRMRITGNNGLSNISTAEVTVVDTTEPDVAVIDPISDIAVQGEILLQAQAYDFSELIDVTFTIREQVGESGKPVGFENLMATYNGAAGNWQYIFDSTQLPDGCYIIFAEATDEYGNSGVSEIVSFSIRNWSVVKKKILWKKILWKKMLWMKMLWKKVLWGPDRGVSVTGQLIKY